MMHNDVFILFLISIKNGCNQLCIFAVLARTVLRAGSSPHVRAGWSRLDHAERKHERVQRWRCRTRAGALGFDVGQAARTILRCVLRRAMSRVCYFDAMHVHATIFVYTAGELASLETLTVS